MSRRRATRREFLATGAAALGAVACSPRLLIAPQSTTGATTLATTRPPPPNFLLIASDDQAYEDSGCCGNATIGTPNIDRLASEGLRFTRAFTPTAICQPSRGAIHTGLHGTTSGADGFLPIKPGVVPLSALLKRAGYRTALIGKTHLEPIAQFEFDLLKPSSELQSGRDVDAIASAARAFVKECAGARQPFFLNVNFDDPHWPWPLTAEAAQKELPRWLRHETGVDPRHRALGHVAGTHDPAQVRLPALLPDRPEIRGELARYADGITRLDRGVGLLLELLEQEQLAADTVVVFLSDNGMEFPFHKTTLWDGGIHQPLIVRAPGVTPRGATCEGMVSFVDLLPTFLDLANVDAAARPARLEGRSFRAALADPKAPLRDELFLTHSRHLQETAMPSRGLRTAKHKYLRNFWPEGAGFLTATMTHASWPACEAAAKDDPALAARIDRYLHRPPVELYDLEADPLEQTNLARAPGHEDLQDELHARLKLQMAAIADPLLDRV